MNWTASLLRNQLRKQQADFKSRLTLLTETNPQTENYLQLEEKVKVLEANLEATEQNLAKLKSEVKNTENLNEIEVKELELKLTQVKKQKEASKELIFDLQKEIRTNSLYYQQELRKVREDYQAKLKTQTKQLRAEITLLNSSETDQQRELKERGKLIAKLEEQTQETKKELEFSESQLAFANSKVKQLSPLFNQVLSVIKKNVILRGKKDLKEAIANIQELMEWEKSPLITEINTPTEPVKTAEQLALEEELNKAKKTIMDKKDLETKNTDLEQTVSQKDKEIAELETKIESLQKQEKKTKELMETESNLLATEQNLTRIKIEAELKEKLKEITIKKEQNKVLEEANASHLEQIKQLEQTIKDLKKVKEPVKVKPAEEVKPAEPLKTQTKPAEPVKSQAQQWLDENYPKEKRSEIKDLEINNKRLKGFLDLSDFINLKNLDCRFSAFTSLDLSECKELERLDCFDNPLKEIIYPSADWFTNWKDKTWKKIRDNTRPIPSLVKLVDTYDLDNWVENYDSSKIGDLNYHVICGRHGKFAYLDYTALDNLGNKVIARKSIILARLLVEKEELPELAIYEEKMNELADDLQLCGSMNLPGKKDGTKWPQLEQWAVAGKALAGDKELLSRLQDLPYLHPDYKFDSPSYKFKETATEPSASDKKKLKKWKNISLDFTIELINQWESKGFSFEQTADWINTGFKPTETDYVWWLEKKVGYDPLKYLNETSSEEQQDLKKQFEEYKEKK